MRRIFLDHLETSPAQDDLATLIGLLDGPERICLMCLEADPAHCHRALVADAVTARRPTRIEHLSVA